MKAIHIVWSRHRDQDLTKGPLAKQIFVFSLPLVFSNLLQVLFNVADIAVVGRFAGSLALGSVGSTTILVSMFTGFLIGLAGGINVLVAMFYGAKNEKTTSEMVHSASLLSLVIGCLLLLFGLVFARPVLELMHTKEELIDGAVLYLRIYFLGMPALAMYNFGNAVFSAVGDTRRPVIYLTIAGIINMILNLVFVIVFRMDVAGVALASAISQTFSAFMVVRVLFRMDDCYGMAFSKLKPNWQKIRMLLKIGLPSGIQTAIFAFANLFVQAGVNTFSAVTVAGNSAATNADTLVYDVMAAFYTACGSFIGQNCGARNRKRILRSYFISMGYALLIGCFLGLSLFACGPRFLGLFTTEPAVVEQGMLRLKVMSISYGFSAFMDSTIAASRGLGRSTVPTVIVILGSCVFRIIWIYTIFAYFGTITSLYLLYIFSWGITAVAEMIYFRKVYRECVKDFA